MRGLLEAGAAGYLLNWSLADFPAPRPRHGTKKSQDVRDVVMISVVQVLFERLKSLLQTKLPMSSAEDRSVRALSG